MATTTQLVAPAAAMDALVCGSTTDAADDRHTKRSGASVLLRSLAVQPLPSMRIRHVQRVRTPLAANQRMKAGNVQQQRASASIATAASISSSSTTASPTTATAASPLSLSLSSASTSVPPLTARLQQLWKLNAWFIFAVTMLFCLARVSASASASSSSGGLRAPSDWYIVLVSIPVLDKVLPLKHLAEELLHRGYRVGFALPENCRQWVSDIERLEFISLGNIVGKGRGSYREVDELARLGVYESYAATLRYYASFQRPMFSALVEQLEDDRPHLVVVDRYTFAGLDASHALQLPYVVNAPHLLLDMDSPPAYIPAPFTNYSMHTTSVLERCLNSYYRLRFRLVLVQVFKEVNAVRREHGLAPIESKHRVFGEQLVLVNSAFGLDFARALAPQFQLVGAMRSRRVQLAAPTHLPLEYLTWLALDSAARPIVFISFQSDVPLSPQFVATLMDGLEAVDTRLVWKISLQEQAAFDLRSRSRASVFFAGDDVDEALLLARSPVAALITAGDFQSIQEALVSGVPMLGIPFSAEQLEGVEAAARAGAAIVLVAHAFTEQNVQRAVEQLLGDSDHDYRACAQHTGELVLAAGGAPRAADFVAVVLEVGPQFLLPVKNTQALYKTYLVDVYLVYGAILCGAAVILRTFVAVLYSLFQMPPELDGATPSATAGAGAGAGTGQVQGPNPPNSSSAKEKAT